MPRYDAIDRPLVAANNLSPLFIDQLAAELQITSIGPADLTCLPSVTVLALYSRQDFDDHSDLLMQLSRAPYNIHASVYIPPAFVRLARNGTWDERMAYDPYLERLLDLEEANNLTIFPRDEAQHLALTVRLAVSLNIKRDRRRNLPAPRILRTLRPFTLRSYVDAVGAGSG